MKYVCKHCSSAHNSEHWNKATMDAYEDIKPIEKVKCNPYLKRGFLYVCPSCNQSNESQFIKKVNA
jgi:DNA-directed RNA polymerase subunit RPC12/RpoP